MDISATNWKLTAGKDRLSLLTIALFVLVLIYTIAVLPLAYLIAQRTSLGVADIAAVLTPIGTILVSLLLAALYYRMLTVQDTQVDIMDRQAKWAEAANSPAIIIDQWWVKNSDTIVFRLHNKGNSHVEELRLLVDLQVINTMTGDTMTEFESRSTLSKEDVEGFESRFMPADTHKPITFTAGIAFEREVAGNSTRFSKTRSVLHDLIEGCEKSLSCEFTMTLETIAPGENVEKREFYRFSVGVFEPKDFADLIEEGQWESRTLHVQPGNSETPV